MFECILVLLMSDGSHDELLVEGKQVRQVMQKRTLDFSKHLQRLQVSGMTGPNPGTQTVDAEKCISIVYE